MRTEKVSYDSMQRLVGMDGRALESDNRLGLEKARAVLRAAMEKELTPRQRECVQLYFFQQMTMESVGQELGIGKATVCRHLQKAKRRLARVLGYAGMQPRRQETETQPARYGRGHSFNSPL